MPEGKPSCNAVRRLAQKAMQIHASGFFGLRRLAPISITAQIYKGPVFRAMTKTLRPRETRLFDGTVSEITKKYCARIGKRSQNFAGHLGALEQPSAEIARASGDGSRAGVITLLKERAQSAHSDFNRGESERFLKWIMETREQLTTRAERLKGLGPCALNAA
jgi:hypothetical protein